MSIFATALMSLASLFKHNRRLNEPPPSLGFVRQSDHSDASRRVLRLKTKKSMRGRNAPALGRANWPLLYWGKPNEGTCPRPLSRKALKRICPNHPVFAKAK